MFFAGHCQTNVTQPGRYSQIPDCNCNIQMVQSQPISPPLLSAGNTNSISYLWHSSIFVLLMGNLLSTDCHVVLLSRLCTTLLVPQPLAICQHLFPLLLAQKQGRKEEVGWRGARQSQPSLLFPRTGLCFSQSRRFRMLVRVAPLKNSPKYLSH